MRASVKILPGSDRSGPQPLFPLELTCSALQVLEEVLKRMRSAHKEKNQRLGQVREDVRLLNIQIEESSQELQNLLRTRDQTVEGLHAMKATIEEENSKWMLEIARRQVLRLSVVTLCIE